MTVMRKDDGWVVAMYRKEETDRQSNKREGSITNGFIARRRRSSGIVLGRVIHSGTQISMGAVQTGKMRTKQVRVVGWFHLGQLKWRSRAVTSIARIEQWQIMLEL